MNIEIADYSAAFTFPHLEEETVRPIKKMAHEMLGLEIDVSPQFLEFDYSGRDTGRQVVAFLRQISPLIGTAEGKAECRLTTQTDDIRFEFYFIEGGCLYRQEAKIVRMPPSEVRLETSHKRSSETRAVSQNDEPLAE